MRVVIVACVLLTAQSAAAGPKRLAVPPIEAHPEEDEDVQYLASELTRVLRAQVRASEGEYELTTDERELAQLRRHTKCEPERTACLVVIAKELGGEALVFGSIERNVLGQVEGYDVTLKLVRVGGRIVHTRNARAPLTNIRSWIVTNAPIVFADLVGARRPPGPESFACDSYRLRGEELTVQGEHALALHQYNRALMCKYDPDLHPKAFVAACNAKNLRMAKFYYQVLEDKTLVQECVRVGIDPRK